jgi:hypothetical protein
MWIEHNGFIEGGYWAELEGNPRRCQLQSSPRLGFFLGAVPTIVVILLFHLVTRKKVEK